MGWLWTSNKSPSTPPSPTQTITSPSSSAPTPQAPEPSTADAELHALLSSAQTSPSPPPPSSPSRPLQPLQPPPPSSSNNNNDPNKITPTTPHPSTLSCRTAFDAAFHCQSFGGQFANIYRYGSLRSCSEHWADFWFCVRTNRGFMDEERRKETVRAWAVNREREKYGMRGEGEGGKGSSEDVWEKRRWKVRGAFGGDWGDLEREGREREGREREGAEVEVEVEVRGEVR